jgi:hypothetical protein
VFTCVHACPRCGKDHGHAIRKPSSPLDAFELYCVPCSRIEAEQINNGTFHEPVRRRTAGRVDDQEYAVGDQVTYQGYTWIALALNIGNPPLGESNVGSVFWGLVGVAEDISDTLVLTMAGQRVLLQIPKKS